MWVCRRAGAGGAECGACGALREAGGGAGGAGPGPPAGSLPRRPSSALVLQHLHTYTTRTMQASPLALSYAALLLCRTLCMRVVRVTRGSTHP